VNSYRDPSPAGWDFATLLDRVGRIPGMRRVRFTTSHPRDFVKEIVQAIDDNTALCNHVHLPVQSGSDSVLARMQRLYTRDEYVRRIEWMKMARRNVSITTDIIVGFRAKAKRIFRQRSTCSTSGIRFPVRLQVSPRPNTAALGMEDKVPRRRRRAAS